MQVRAEQTVVLREDASDIDRQPRHRAAPVGEQHEIVGGIGRRERRRKFFWQEAHRNEDALMLRGVTLAFQHGIARSLSRREAGDVLVADADGGEMRRHALRCAQDDAERRAVLDEQPVIVRHEVHAIQAMTIQQGDLGKRFSRQCVSKSGDDVFLHARRIEMVDGGQEFFCAAADQLGHAPPVEGAEVAHAHATADLRDGPGGEGAQFAIAFAGEAARFRGVRQAENFAALQFELHGAAGCFGKGGRGLPEQIDVRCAQFGEGLRIKDKGVRCGQVGVHQHEHLVGAFVGNTADGEDVILRRAEAGQRGVVEERGMIAQEFIKFAQFGNDVFRAAPGESTAGVDVDLLRREPFHAAGETESAAHAGQGAETIAQERPGAAHLRETVVVVRLAVVNVEADAAALFESVVEVVVNLLPRMILEQFGVGPLHPALGEQILGGLPGTAKAFEQKDRFGKFLHHARGDVTPRGHGNLVAGVAAETIDAAPAPFEEHVGEMLPERGIVVRLQFHEVFPHRAPGAGADERAALVAQEPFWVPLLQRRAPAGVIDDNVEEDLRAPRVRGVSQLAKLIDAGGELVEDDERRIDGEQIFARVRTAEPPEARVGRGRGLHGQEMKNAAAERVHDVRQLGDEVAQFAGGRDDAVAFLIEHADVFVRRGFDGGSQFARGAEHAREGAVDGIRRAIGVGMNADAEVRSFRPVQPALGIDGVTLRVIEARLHQ